MSDSLSMIEKVELLRAQPGDILVCSGHIDPSNVERLEQKLKSFFSFDIKVMFLSGAELKLLRPEPLTGETDH